MSKFLKVIVNLVVLFSIAIAAALLVPPFVGIDTVVNDNTNMETNLPVGSVAYGKEIKVKELKKKDKIIYNEGSSTYVYEITGVDHGSETYEVKNPYSKGNDTEEVNLQKSVPKVAVVVPLIGYAAIALQSKEGLIVIGLGIVFLIILFILSEVWRKDDEDEDDDDEEEYEDDDEDEEEEELSRKERRRLRKEEKRRRKEEKRRRKEEEYDEEDDDDEEEEEELSRKERRRLKKEEKLRRKEEKRRRKLEKKGLLEEELLEEDEDIETKAEEKKIPEVKEDQSEELEEVSENDLQGFDEAMKEAMSSIALGVSQVNEPVQEEQNLETKETSEISEENEGVEEAINIEESHLEETAETVEEQMTEESSFDVNAILKAPSVEELLAKAEAAGDKPEVKKDKENELTLLDYSDIL